MKTKEVRVHLLLVAALGHLLCWVGGDLLLYFVPNGPLDTMGLFSYEDTARMLAGVNPLQFTLSGIFGVIAMMLALPGYYQIYQFLKPVAKKSACITLIGALMTCIPGAVMHFTCTSMLWYFVNSGADKAAHDIMLAFFMETGVTTAMCNIGIFMVCIPLLIAVAKGKTCLPRRAWLINTLPLTLVCGVIFAKMGAMNVASALMFLGLYAALRNQHA